MQETSQIRWLMYCKSAICKIGQFELDYVINWKPVKLFEQGSDGEKRGDLSTTRARQFCTRCSLETSCLAMLFNSNRGDYKLEHLILS